MENERNGSGPFIIDKDGKKSDRDFWNKVMTPEIESKFDRYMKIKRIGVSAKKELEKRKSQQAFESLIESLK